MQNQWQTLLEGLSTPLESHQVTQGSKYIAYLTNFETLKVTGPDRHTFLQGQMTCDFNDIEGKVLLGANCNLKGRACATFYALDDGQSTYLILPNGQAAFLKSLLDKYAMFANAELVLPSEELLVVGFIGENAPLLVDPPIPQGTHAKINNTSLSLCITSPRVAKQWLAQDCENLIATTQNTWDQQQIEAGISHITTDSQEQFIPQELNYDLIGGISFNKGCYKGQEIIARLHYKGTYKQRALRFQYNSTTAPKAGTPLYNNTSEQACGHVIQSAVTTRNTVELLAVTKLSAINTDNSESEPLHLEQKDGPILSGLSLPYAITNKGVT